MDYKKPTKEDGKYAIHIISCPKCGKDNEFDGIPKKGGFDCWSCGFEKQLQEEDEDGRRF